MRSRADALWPAALVALVTLAFSDLLLFGRFLYFRDVVRLFVPIRVLLREALASGQMPLWNPSWAGGQPLAANPLFETFYPVQLLTLLCPNPAFGYGLEFVSHIALAAVGMFLFLRSLALRPPAAAFGAISFALGGTALSLSNLPTMLAALAWLPLLALFGRRLLRQPNARDFALAALVLGTILLTGEQSLTLQAGALLGAYALTREGRARALLLLAALVVVALFVGAAQIIPALDHLRDSGRDSAISYHAATIWSFPPARILELAFPTLFATYGVAIFDWSSGRFHPGMSSPLIHSTYFGLLGCALVITGYLRRLRGRSFVTAVALAGLIAGFGTNTPLAPVLYAVLYRFIRYPEKWIISSIFIFTVFAAMAADRLDDDLFARTAKRVAVTIAAIAVLLAATAYLPMFPDFFARLWQKSGYIGDYVDEYRRGALTTAVIATALALLFALRSRMSRTAWLAGLAVFVLLDLGIRVKPLTPTVGADYYDPPPITAQLGSPRQVRIYNEADELPKGGHERSFDQWFVANHDAMFPEMQSIWGYGSILGIDISLTHLKPAIDLKNVFRAMQQQHNPAGAMQILAMSGTTDIITPASDPRSLEPQLFKIPGQRYYFADQCLRLTPAQIAARLLANERFSPRIAFIDAPPFTPAPGRVLRSSETMNTIDLDVESAGNAALMIAVTRHKYWHASIDGRAATLHPANIAFQMLIVPGGRHHVALRYRNPLVSACLAISILSSLILSAVALRSRARPPQPTR